MRKFVFALLIVLGSSVSAYACGGRVYSNSCGVGANAFYGNSYGVNNFAFANPYPYTVGNTVFVNNAVSPFVNVNVNQRRGVFGRRNNVNVQASGVSGVNVNVNSGRRR